MLLALALVLAARPHLVAPETFTKIADEYSGEVALEHVRELVEHHRIQGSPMMAAAASKVVLARLKAQGIEARLDTYPSDGKIRYQAWTSPMGWQIRGGELWVEGGERLCRQRDVPMCVSTYSKGGTFSGELVDVGEGTRPESYAGKDVKDKVVLASGYAAKVVRQAVLRFGAAGVVIYPAAGDRPDHPDMIRYNGMWTHADEVPKTRGGFQISRNQYAKLKAAMEKGPVRVRGTIDADLGPGELTLVHAYIRGAEHPEEEVLLTAHLDHPKWSANDNASGSAALLELARTLDALIAAKKLPRPRRTLHFVWVPEFFGTMAWVTKHPEVRRCGGAWDDPRPPSPAKGCVVANLNLDMVGEDTVKTNSIFYFTHAPASVPSFLDPLLADVLEQTREANLRAPTGSAHTWFAEGIAYANGSDHDVFLGLGIPSTMLGHDPDWTHHTSEDTIDKVDPTELRRAGVLSAAAAWWIANAVREDWESIARRMLASRIARAAARHARAPDERTAAELAAASAELAAGKPSADPYAGVFGAAAPKSSGGARRRVLVPYDDDELDALPAADQEWWAAQEERFSGDGGSPSAEIVLFEAVNFLDGRKDHAAVAEALSRELGADFDAAWVERLFKILASKELIVLPR